MHILSEKEKKILRMTDHTLLSPDATMSQIRVLCEEGLAFQTASVCVPPIYVRIAADCLENKLPVCTVIGFPLGYQMTEVKVFETKKAIDEGADEIDLVIPVGFLKAEHPEIVREHIMHVRRAATDKILKVIIETCLLTEKEKIKMCQLVTECHADYIKTSTGFATGGATVEDIALLKQHVGSNVKVKASGGISSVSDALKLIEAGADRLGTSRMVKLITGSRTVNGY